MNCGHQCDRRGVDRMTPATFIAPVDTHRRASRGVNPACDSHVQTVIRKHPGAMHAKRGDARDAPAGANGRDNLAMGARHRISAPSQSSQLTRRDSDPQQMRGDSDPTQQGWIRNARGRFEGASQVHDPILLPTCPMNMLPGNSGQGMSKLRPGEEPVHGSWTAARRRRSSARG